MNTKRRILNPFFTNMEIPNDYFCGREKETGEIIRLLTNGNNLVLKAPRRTGKSSLIKHIFHQREIECGYNTMYIDIMGTTNADGFIRIFRNEIFKQKFSLPVKARETIKDMLTHTSIEAEFNPTVNMMLPKIGFNAIGNIELSIDALFDILEKTDRPNIVVFDEFQQVENYPENMTAVLRSHVQQSSNTKFIFSGSEPHLLSSMFQDRNKPFYDSAVSMNLDILPLDTYSEFCTRQFKDFGKNINPDTIRLIYHLFCGVTYYMQETMNCIFSMTEKNETADSELALQIIEQSIDRRDQNFRDILSRMPGTKERKLLFCIANEGIATGILSTDMIRRYQLDSPSSIQNAIANLTNSHKNKKAMPNSQGIVSEIAPNTYKLTDKYFELWLVKELPSYQFKIDNAEMLFNNEREIMKSSPMKNLKAMKKTVPLFH